MEADDEGLPALTLVFLRPEGSTDVDWSLELLDCSSVAYEAIERENPRFSILKAFTFDAGAPYQTIREECDALSARLRAAEGVVEAAKAEVLAQGYRSSDMAHALIALLGPFWFETTDLPKPPVCGYEITTEMDDGPLIERCFLAPHEHGVEHHFRASYALAALDTLEET